MKQTIKDLGLPGIRVNASGCLDRCEMGPAMVIYPQGIWYRYETEADVNEIIDAHIQKGDVVHRLLMDKTSP